MKRGEMPSGQGLLPNYSESGIDFHLWWAMKERKVMKSDMEIACSAWTDTCQQLAELA